MFETPHTTTPIGQKLPLVLRIWTCSQCATFGPLLIRAVLMEPNIFLFRLALKDHPSKHFTTGDPAQTILVPFDGDP